MDNPISTPQPTAPPPDSEEAIKEQVLAELQQEQAVQARLAVVKERNPHVFSRLTILGTLFQIQEALGGEFIPRVAWLHLNDNILNVRRVGNVDFETLTVAIEVHEYNEIAPGIVFLPVDHICWAGTTDKPYGDEHVSFTSMEGKHVTLPANYAAVRRRIAGLDEEPAVKA